MDHSMAQSFEQSPILIVGAGIGGLSAAIRLAAAGRRVIVLEQNPSVGGKMGQVTADGFRWDTGPSVITMRHVFEDLFTAAGRKLDDYLTLLPVDPLTRYFYPDGVVLDASRDLPFMAAQIEALDPRDVAGYLRYLAYASELHRITGPVFIYGPPPSPLDFARVSVRDMVKVDPLRNMGMAIRSFVRSPHLRQLLGRFATYVGGSPFAAPATLNVIAHVEMTGGVWYPQGGIYAIAAALRRLAEELGVEMRTDAGVKRITVDENTGHVTGVNLADGSHLDAQQVIANVDVTTVYGGLLADSAVSPAKVRRTRGMEPSCSGFILLLGVEGEHPELAHHNIFFSSDYPKEFREIFKMGLPPTEPTVYVAITSKSDPDHAPPGCENWFVLVNAPALGPEWDWSTQAPAYRDRVLAVLADFGYDVRGRMRSERMLTPLDLERLTGTHRGALYGQSPNSRWSAFRRPPNRSKDIPGLYFAGGATHPGGGVPMVTLSGKVAAEMVLGGG